MPFSPESSTAKFDTGGESPMDLDAGAIENEDAEVGENFEEPIPTEEPAIMLSQGQADAAGMTGAAPGSKFTVTLTVGDVNDTGFNVTLDPGSAMPADALPPMEGEDAGTDQLGNSSVKGPESFGIPTGLTGSPQVGNI